MSHRMTLQEFISLDEQALAPISSQANQMSTQLKDAATSSNSTWHSISENFRSPVTATAVAQQRTQLSKLTQFADETQQLSRHAEQAHVDFSQAVRNVHSALDDCSANGFRVHNDWTLEDTRSGPDRRAIYEQLNNNLSQSRLQFDQTDKIISQKLLNFTNIHQDTKAPPPPPKPIPREQRIAAVIAKGRSQIGTPYAWGGGNKFGPTRGIHDWGYADQCGDYNKIGFDCSGLMTYCFYQGAHIELPRTSGAQYNAGRKIPLAQLQPGDMVFYGYNGSNHVALYTGNNRMLEAPMSGMTIHETQLRRTGNLQPYGVRMIP